jgi:hypothetical protein
MPQRDALGRIRGGMSGEGLDLNLEEEDYE